MRLPAVLIAALVVLPTAARAGMLMELHAGSSFGAEDGNFRLVHRAGNGGGLGFQTDFTLAGNAPFSVGFAMHFDTGLTVGSLASVDPMDSGIFLRFRLAGGAGLGLRLKDNNAVMAVVGLHGSGDSVREEIAFESGPYVRAAFDGKKLGVSASLFWLSHKERSFRELELVVRKPLSETLRAFAGLAWAWQQGGLGFSVAPQVGIGLGF